MYDLIVIGSGPGGYVAAIRASQLGLKTCVVEKDKSFGGTCLNVGCIPSKALLESSEHYSFTKNSLSLHGVNVKDVSFSLKEMMKRKNKVVLDLTRGIDFLFKKNKIDSLKSWGKILSPTEVEITRDGKKEVLKTKNILIATGSEPISPPFARIDEDHVVSSTGALSFSEVPEKLVVIGAGYIGLELGSVWMRLGSEVTVIEYQDSICPGMDQDLRDKLYELLKKQGMKFHLSSQVSKVEPSSKGVKVFFEDKEGKETSLEVSKALCSVGRKAFVKNLGLESVGVQSTSKGEIEVDQNFKTSVSSIFAIGDVIPGPMLAHKAEEEGVAVAEFIATGHSHVNYDTLPSIVYTHPEAASVGKTEDQLRSASIKYNKSSFPFLANGRARCLGDTDGFVKVLSCQKTDKILGVHIIGPRAGDLIAEAVVAMEFHSSSEDLARSFHAHPTLSEALREAMLGVDKRTRQF